MTAPTTREELVEWLAGEIDGYSNNHTRDYLNRLLKHMWDAGLVVCPREPTPHMVDMFFHAPVTDTSDAFSNMIAASPFTPKEPTDG